MGGCADQKGSGSGSGSSDNENGLHVEGLPYTASRSSSVATCCTSKYRLIFSCKLLQCDRSNTGRWTVE